MLPHSRPSLDGSAGFEQRGMASNTARSGAKVHCKHSRMLGGYGKPTITDQQIIHRRLRYFTHERSQSNDCLCSTQLRLRVLIIASVHFDAPNNRAQPCLTTLSIPHNWLFVAGPGSCISILFSFGIVCRHILTSSGDLPNSRPSPQLCWT